MPAEDPNTAVRIEVLARIAAGLCRDAGISRVELNRDNGWSWNNQTRVLLVGCHSLARLGVEACAGIIAHEVGHSFLSRGSLVGRYGCGFPYSHRWLNAVEDPRVEAWMARRYPGVAAWLERAGAASARSWTPNTMPATRHEQWVLGACRGDANRGDAFTALLLPEVRQALLSTAQARREYRDDFLPPSDPAEWEALAHSLAEEHDALCVRYGLDPEVEPNERVARTLSIRAWAHFNAQIAPVVLALFERDIEEIASLVAHSSGLRSALESPKNTTPPLAPLLREAREGTARNRPCLVDDAARELARAWLLARAAKRVAARAAARGVEDDTSLIGAAAAPVRVRPSRQALVARLEHVLADTLEKRRRALGRTHAANGTRADLRRVMANEGAFAGDPSRWRPAWHRPTKLRHDAAFGLLIDCSGSMRGTKIAAAIEAASVFVEALTRVGTPCFVAGFQDELFQLAPLGATRDEALRGVAAAAREVAGTRPGGRNRPNFNDDGPCVLAAAETLAQVQAAQRVLVVLSDGRPAGRRSNEAALHAAVQLTGREGVVQLIGIGVGAGATHVRAFYPRSIVVDRVDELPAALVGVLSA